MMSARSSHRLDGLEPDNLLAFLALLGLLRALEADDRERDDQEKLWPRAAWDLQNPPLRPRLWLAQDVSQDMVLSRAAHGLEVLVRAHDFGGRTDLNHSRAECRALLGSAARDAVVRSRDAVDLLASLMTDGAIKDGTEEAVDPTPLCLLFGQGHQHFLARLADVARQVAPPSRGKGQHAVSVTAIDCLREALFHPWHRDDPTASFRWDPQEDVRYALMAGDPTDPMYKSGTQHGANRLAAVGLGALTLAPESRGGRVRPSVTGGKVTAHGFAFAWPISRDPATLAAIRALLAHPRLHEPGALAPLGVEYVMVARRISVGKFMNIARATVLAGP